MSTFSALTKPKQNTNKNNQFWTNKWIGVKSTQKSFLNHFQNKTKPNHGWLCLFVCYGKWLNGCWLNVKEMNTWCDQKKQWGIALYSDFHNRLFSTQKCRNLHLRKPPWYSRRKKTWEKPDSKGNLSSSEWHQIGKYW